MLTPTITITLLDREVVLTRENDIMESYCCANHDYWIGRYPSGLWVARCTAGSADAHVDVRSHGDSFEEVVADFDQKLRDLREWLR
jgi:hypothetical protein